MMRQELLTSEQHELIEEERERLIERKSQLEREYIPIYKRNKALPGTVSSAERERLGELVRELEQIDNQIDELNEMLYTSIGYDAYHRMAGEVEARNVSKRMEMTDEQRRQSLAADTEDVARDEQIVRFGNGVSMSEGDGVFTFSDRYAQRGGRFYQDSKGNIDLVDIDQSVFDKMGAKKMPFRMTDGMAHHVFEQHAKELGLKDEADAVRYVVDIMTNFDHVREGRDAGTYIFSIENGRNTTSHRSITIVLPESDGEYMGIKTSGRERLSSIQKMPLLWEKSAEPSATDAVSANVTSELPNENGRANGSASNQSNGIGGKVSENSSDSQMDGGETTNFRVRGGHEAAVEDARRRLESGDASEFERQAARAVIKAYGGGDAPDTPDGGGRSADKQQLAVFGQGPHLVVDHQLQLVDMIADAVEQSCDRVVIGKGTLAHVVDAVGHFAVFYHLRHLVADGLHVMVDGLDSGQLVCCHLLKLLATEQLLELASVVEQ